jgi:uncharacterized protein YqeY
MLRERFSETLKTAMKGKDTRTVSTIRMVIAKLKERDIEARAKGNSTGIPDAEIQQMMQGMVKQRRESIALYEQGGRQELAQQEREEIQIIEGFMPKQLDEAGTEALVKGIIAELGAESPKDMGRVMAVLKERHAGEIDMSRASAVTKKLLS